MAPLIARGGRRVAAGTSHAARGGPPGWLAVALFAAALVLLLFLQYGYALTVPFINDDFVFLDKTRAASFASLWGARDLAFHWYRPWSRELHYWALQKLFGAHEAPFHLVSFALWVAVLGLYLALVRRIAGLRIAAVATAGVAVLAAWGVPAVWIAGVQDLWMMAFALLALLALASGWGVLAAASFVLALLSKETAAVLPALALLHERTIAGRPWTAALRRTGAWWAVLVVWALLHPALGGRLLHPLAPAADAAVRAPVTEIAGRTLAMLVNLDERPAPESGWAQAALRGAPAALIAIGLAGLGFALGARRRQSERPAASLALFGAGWAVLGWLPLLMPGLGWHAYYALFGALGAWLILALVLARSRALALLTIALLAALRAVHADTPSRDWGSEWYQKRAATFLAGLRTNLQGLYPGLPPHSRLFFVKVPSNVGFLAGDGPALRVWYGDSTLTAGFYGSYRVRADRALDDRDYFFRYDSTTGWVPVIAGNENFGAARAAGETWRHDHEVLAGTFAKAGDWSRAAIEYAKLAQLDSLNVDYAHDAGVGFETAGDSVLAAHWYAEAAARPGADAEVRALAKRFARHLRGSP